MFIIDSTFDIKLDELVSKKYKNFHVFGFLLIFVSHPSQICCGYYQST